MFEGVSHELGAQLVRQRPADDLARAKIDDHGQIEPAGRRGYVGDVASPNLIGFVRERLIDEQIGRGCVGASVAGSWHVSLWLDGFQAALDHDSAHTIGGADDTAFREFLPDPPVAVATTVALEDGLDDVADFLVGALRGG